MLLRADLLNQIEITFFPGLNSNNNTLMVIGGVHGDEPQSAKGTELLREYLKNPENIFTQLLLERSRIVVIPIINPVGYLAGARACPKSGLEVEYVDAKVVVKDDEKHMFKFPPKWQDPNRGWEENETLVKIHFERLKTMFSPSLIIFNHNWDIPQGRLHVYASADYFESISDIKQIFANYYHTHNIFGDPWSFLELADQTSSSNFTFKIMEKFNLPVFLTETYVYSDESPKIHLALNLYLLAKFVEIPLDDETLAVMILQELKNNYD